MVVLKQAAVEVKSSQQMSILYSYHSLLSASRDFQHDYTTYNIYIYIYQASEIYHIILYDVRYKRNS